MKVQRVPIDRAGRLVLPKALRHELAIKPGDKLQVSVHGSSVILTPEKHSLGLVRKGKALVFATEGEATLDQDTVRRILEKEQGSRIRQLAGSFVGQKSNP